MSVLLHIAERALNRPLMVHPDKLPLILGVLEGRIPLGDISGLKEIARANIEILPEGAQATMFGPNPTASRFVGSASDEDPMTGKRTALPYKRTREGVAIIPVIGSLINRGAWIGSNSGETSYEGLKFQIGHAAGDERTSAILLDIDSPGGEAVGAFEVADAVRSASTKKPVTAVVNGMAASAAYAIAAGAGRIVTTQTGVVGSIGVRMVHADFSGKLAKEGIKATIIDAPKGGHKSDVHPFKPLSEEAASDLQAEIDQFYEMFVQSVDVGRARMTERAIRKTEGRVYIGRAAVDIGLADEVGTFESAIADLVSGKSATSAPSNRVTTSVQPMTTNARVETPKALSTDELATIINGKAPKPSTSAIRTMSDVLSPDQVAAFVNNKAVAANTKSETSMPLPSMLGADAPEIVAKRVNGRRPSVANEELLARHGWGEIIEKINAEAQALRGR